MYIIILLLPIRKAMKVETKKIATFINIHGVRFFTAICICVEIDRNYNDYYHVVVDKDLGFKYILAF